MAKAYAEGDNLADKVTILKFLQIGGQGLAYKATYKPTGEVVFVKQLNADPKTTGGRVARQRFHRERSISIESKHIPKVLDDFEFEGSFFIVTEFIEGQNLDELLAIAKAPFSNVDIRDILSQSGKGLAAAHDKGIVHRDIKLANLMMGTDRILRLVDWGLAGFVDGRTIFDGGDLKGTLHFMSPEHIASKGIDRQSDLFSLGTVAYICLTLHYPFDGADETEIFRSILHDDPPPPQSLNSAVDDSLNAIVLRLLEKEKTKRYPDAHALLRDLEEGFGASDPKARCKCGVLIALDARYCVKCGGRLHAPREPYTGILRILNGRFEGREIEISPSGMELGRHNLSPDDDFISRRHAMVSFKDSSFWIEDLGSLNGTSVNSLNIPKGGSHPLSPGAHIRLADTFVEFVA